MRALFIFLVLLTVSGCSLKSAPKSGLRILLEKTGAWPTLAPSALFNQTFSIFAAVPPAISSSLTNVGCFQVGVSGSLVGSASTCNGQISLGVSSAVQTSVDGSFTMLMPVSESATFTAYGFASTGGACPSLSSASGDSSNSSPGLFKLGTVTANPDGGTVTVPVALSKSSVGLNCGTGAYQVFGEDFNYAGSPLGTTADWTTTAGAIVLANGKVDLANFSPSPNTMQLNRAVDRAKNVRLSMKITYTNASSGTPELILGVTNSGGTSVFACDFRYSPGAPDNLAYGVGAFGSLYMGGVSFGTNYTVNTNHTLVCTIENSGGTVTVTARAFDSTGTQIGSDEVASGLTQDTSAAYPYFYRDANTKILNAGTVATTYLIEQASGAFP